MASNNPLRKEVVEEIVASCLASDRVLFTGHKYVMRVIDDRTALIIVQVPGGASRGFRIQVSEVGKRLQGATVFGEYETLAAMTKKESFPDGK